MKLSNNSRLFTASELSKVSKLLFEPPPKEVERPKYGISSPAATGGPLFIISDMHDFKVSTLTPPSLNVFKMSTICKKASSPRKRRALAKNIFESRWRDSTTLRDVDVGGGGGGGIEFDGMSVTLLLIQGEVLFDDNNTAVTVVGA